MPAGTDVVDAWSFFQLLLNVVLLIVVGAAGLHTQRAIWRWRSPAEPT